MRAAPTLIPLADGAGCSAPANLTVGLSARKWNTVVNSQWSYNQKSIYLTPISLNVNFASQNSILSAFDKCIELRNCIQISPVSVTGRTPFVYGGRKRSYEASLCCSSGPSHKALPRTLTEYRRPRCESAAYTCIVHVKWQFQIHFSWHLCHVSRHSEILKWVFNSEKKCANRNSKCKSIYE